MKAINLRLESLRALSAHLLKAQNGTLSDEKVFALVQAGKGSGDTGNSSSAYIIDEIILEEFVTSPE